MKTPLLFAGIFIALFSTVLHAQVNVEQVKDINPGNGDSRPSSLAKAGNKLFFIAYDGDEALGYVRLRNGENYSEFNDLPSIEIVRIYAVKPAIGKGVGSALIKKCIETANELNRKIIWLGVWEDNKRAIDFYIKWGFKKFGQHDFVLGTDVQTDWLMMKYL